MKLTNSLCLLLLVLLCSCGGGKGSDVRGTVIQGRVTLDGYEGRYVRLETTDGSYAVADSARVQDGRFGFTLEDSVPTVYTLVLKQTDDDIFPITLPVVSEHGKVTASLGERVLTMGTPLNDLLQDFLLAVSSYNDSLGADTPIEKVKEDFARLVETSILQNAGNPVGAYLYRLYGGKLTPEQREGIDNRLGKQANH